MQIEYLLDDFKNNPTPHLKNILINLCGIAGVSIGESKSFAASLFSGAIEDAYSTLWEMKQRRIFAIKEEVRNFVPQRNK
jgi:hypothetical protein